MAQGFLAVKNIDFTETYAPTARSVTVRMVLAMAAILNLDLRQFDVETAFLGAPLKEEIYMEAPHGLDGIPDGHVLRIKRSLYGLPQASRCFWHEMDSHLKTSGFSASDIDPCLYYRIRKEDYTIIALIVDDMIVATNAKVGSILKIMERRFKMKNLGEVKWCLGMKVSRDRDNNYVFLSQDTYIGKVMRAFKMDDPKVKGADTPGSTSKKMSKAD